MLRYEVHRENDAIYFLLHGKEHRILYPSFISRSGYLSWMEYGRLHRIGKPAATRSSGECSYWIRGVELNKMTCCID